MVILLLLGLFLPVFSSLGPVHYFSESEMTKAIFDSLLLNGQVAVIRGASSFWPLANWTCEQFRSSPHMRGFSVERVYGENDGAFVPLCPACEAWETDKRPSLNDDNSGPAFAPLYWDVRRNRTSLEVIDALTPPWHFISKANHFWKREGVELWFSPPNAGAKYHIDAHVQATVVSQLTGTRRWRLALAPEGKKIGLIPDHLDSDSFDWTPEHTIVLTRGDMLVFPPGSIHDTVNIGSECAVSVTHPLGVPYPVKFFRKHFRRLLRLGDAREVWRVISDLATFGFLKPRMTLTSPFFEAHSDIASEYNETDPLSFFLKIHELYINREPALIGHFGNRLVREYIAYHDTDGDGRVSASEFVEGAMEWLIVEKGLFEKIPPKFRPMRFFYQTVENTVGGIYWHDLREWLNPPEPGTTTMEDDPAIRDEL